MRVGSLFSGVGGLDLGVELALGGQPAFLCEADRSCQEVLSTHYPGVPIIGDVHELDGSIGPIDILHGGYPCQPFSVAGRRGGENDPRHLWPQFARCVRVLRPRLVVLENVAGHLVLGFDSVLADLAEMGYDARWGSVRASDVGAPHRRERLFVVAYPAGGGLEGRDGEPADALGRREGTVVAHPDRDDARGEGQGASGDGEAAEGGRLCHAPRRPEGDTRDPAAADTLQSGEHANGRVPRGGGRAHERPARTPVPPGPQVAHPADTVEDRAGAAADPVGVGRHGWGGADAGGEAGGGLDRRADAPGHRASAADTAGVRRERRPAEPEPGDAGDGEAPVRGAGVEAAGDSGGSTGEPAAVAGNSDSGERGTPRPAQDQAGADAAPLSPGGRAPADADSAGREGLRPEPAGGVGGEPADRDRASRQSDWVTIAAPPDTERERRPEGRPEPGGRAGEPVPLGSEEPPPDTDESGGEARGDSGHDSIGPRLQPLGSEGIEWGIYGPAIARWAHTIGRPAPRPTDDRGRLNPEFVEWMMGLPAGWTDGRKRTDRLRMLGNAVVPQQAELALRILLS